MNKASDYSSLAVDSVVLFYVLIEVNCKYCK